MKYDKSVIESVIKKIGKSMEIIKTEMENAKSLLTNIQEDWKGSPSEYLTNNMRKSFNNFNTYIEVLADYKKYLEGVLGDIKETEVYDQTVINNVLGG